MLSLATTAQAVSREASYDPYQSDKVLVPSRRKTVDMPVEDDAASDNMGHGDDSQNQTSSVGRRRVSEPDVDSDPGQMQGEGERGGEDEVAAATDEELEQGALQRTLGDADRGSFFLTG
jgi:hypothetical protein